MRSCKVTHLFYTIRLKNAHRSNDILKRPLFSRSSHSTGTPENSLESQSDETREPLFPKEELVRRILKKSDPTMDYGSIYKKYPNAHRALIGKHPERRLVWEEQDCSQAFPSSPEEANLDVMHYLEQRDMWQRRKVIDIPKFCVGSIIAVTRADQWAEHGFSRFVGLCVHINRSRNTKGDLFALRNVIMGEALEIQYPLYSPLIQKIEVLRHEQWENEMPFIGLRFLRDYPLEYSTIDENMEPEEYTEEPKIRKWTAEDEAKLSQHLADIFESRRRR